MISESPFLPPGYFFPTAGFELQVRPVALGFGAFTNVTALGFHHNFADQNQMIHFLKNLAIAGGLLQIVTFGAGSFSVEARFQRSEASSTNATCSRLPAQPIRASCLRVIGDAYFCVGRD
jgi:hypothetical protein